MIRRQRRSEPDRYLPLKVGLFFLAAGVWLAGLLSGLEWLTAAAIVLLLIGLILRFVPRSDSVTPDRGREE